MNTCFYYMYVSCSWLSLETCTFCLGSVSNLRVSSRLILVIVNTFLSTCNNVSFCWMNVHSVTAHCLLPPQRAWISDNLLCQLMLAECNRHLVWHCVTDNVSWFLALSQSRVLIVSQCHLNPILNVLARLISWHRCLRKCIHLRRNISIPTLIPSLCC